MFTARAACPACLNNCPASPVFLCVSLSFSFSLCLSACECLRRAIVEAYGQTIMDNCNGDNNVSLMFHTWDTFGEHEQVVGAAPRSWLIHTHTIIHTCTYIVPYIGICISPKGASERKRERERLARCQNKQMQHKFCGFVAFLLRSQQTKRKGFQACYVYGRFSVARHIK